MNLADPALGDAEEGADLGQGEPLVVVEGEDEAFPVGHAVDGVGEEVLHLVDLEELDGVVGPVGDRVADGGGAAVAALLAAEARRGRRAR